MSDQLRPTRERHQQEGGGARGQGIKYGDVFAVGGDLADQVIAPRNAAAMQEAESAIWGGPTPGGPGNTMVTAAAMNEYHGAVKADQASDVVRNQGISISETPMPGGRMVTEFVAGQVVSQYIMRDTGQKGRENQSGERKGNTNGQAKIVIGKASDREDQNKDDPTKITIGQALEAAGRGALGNEPVQLSDVAAIREAEVRASSLDIPVAGGITEQANAAARNNMWVTKDEEKIKLGNILTDATLKLQGDKYVDREDAARVMDAEVTKRSDAKPRREGVAIVMANAARINQGDEF